MKGKKSTQAVLLVFVLGVWGVIFYRIFSKLTDDDAANLPYDLPGERIATSPVADTFQLLANYNDPFLNKAAGSSHSSGQEAAVVSPQNTIKQTARPVSPPVAQQAQVKYMGMIRNNASKKKVAVISVNGKSSLVQENESFDNIKLLKLYKDSVLVLVGKQKLYIRNTN